jgi:hypothetical protein
MLVVPPLQPYSIRCMWFTSRLSLERTRLYPYFLDCKRRPMILGVQDPDSSPRAFRRVGGQGHSLDGGQSRYSYITMGTVVGFDFKAMGLKPP